MNPIDTSYMDPTGATRAAQRRLAGTLARRACAALAEVLASGSSVGASLKPSARLSLPAADPFKRETQQKEQRRPSPENYHCPRQEKSMEGIDCISLQHFLIPGKILGCLVVGVFLNYRI